MPASLDPQQISVFAILLVAFALLMTERIRNDVVAVLIILALYVTRLLPASEALAGFGSEPAITVAGMFVLSAALHQTGLSDMIGQWIGRLAGSSYSRAIAVIMPAVALFSAFTHHITTTAVMLPVTLNLARDRHIPASRLLMPLSFAASLGTTITIIGAPAFIIASQSLQQAGRPGLGVFSIAPIGLALSLTGTLFMLALGRFLLPSHEGLSEATDHFRLDHYFTEVRILDEAPYVGRTIEQFEAENGGRLEVVGRVRERRNEPCPCDEAPLQPDDVLLIRTTPEEMAAIGQRPGLALNPIMEYGNAPANAEDGETRAGIEEVGVKLVQAVVAPNSDLIGRTIGRVDFRQRYGVLVVGLWRQHGWLHHELAKIRLGAGDVLVLQGADRALSRVAIDRSFLMMAPFAAEARPHGKAPVAALIMLATILAAATGLLSIEMAALAGAIATVLTGCLTGRQAYRAIDARIYVFIAGAIPLGAALQKSGAADLMARWLQAAVGGWPPLLVLLLVFAVTAVLTQFMSDAATTALLAPVALALAHGLGRAPEPFVVTVAMAAVASFLTPIGHHGNLLIYGPGRYQFSDFIRVGTPLTILAALIVAFGAPLLWPG